jgi:undecaprenyl-diphosphatase
MFFLAITFWQKLLQWDQSLFVKINSDWTNPVFDTIMPLLRNSACWVPLYMFMLVFVLLNFKVKGLWWVVFFLCTIALTDMTGNYVFKYGFERLRPCSDPDFFGPVRMLLKNCPAGYSFISNHAANHFGIAIFFIVTFHRVFKKLAWVALPWAAAICYAQIYVGVHYPLDVLAGTMLGVVFGISTGTIFNKRFGFAIFDNQPAA